MKLATKKKEFEVIKILSLIVLIILFAGIEDFVFYLLHFTILSFVISLFLLSGTFVRFKRIMRISYEEGMKQIERKIQKKQKDRNS